MEQGMGKIPGSSKDENKITLTLLNGTGYVFDADDYMKLRAEHRIVGSMVGTRSTHGWSASDSTLPAELSNCETQLLLEQGIAILVSKQQALLSEPSPEELTEYKVAFERSIEQQAEALKTEKLRESSRNIDKIMNGKRKKLLASGVSAEDIQLDPDAILKEIADNFKFERKNALLQIHCAHPRTHSKLSPILFILQSNEAQIVHFPRDTSLKYRVFRDFWLQGKFVTSGEAFGADFLLYPGDPMLFHASHIIVLLDEPQLHPLKMIAKVRLSVIVNKICIFAYFAKPTTNEDESDAELRICYQTVLWEGNRDKEKLKNTTN